MLVLLLPDGDAADGLGPGVAEKLAALGVTSLSVLRDEQTTALTLEGWAFDPNRSGDAAAGLVATDPAQVRVLRPVIESAVHASSLQTRGRSTK